MTTRTFCTKCGSPLKPGAAFCTKCGAVLEAAPAPAPSADLPRAAGAEGTAIPAGSSGGSWTAQATSVAGQVRGVYGMASTAGAMAMGMPWQVVAGNEPFDPRAFALAAAPAAQQAVRASLKRPGLALLVTSVLDLAVALLTGGTARLLPALGRLALAGATSVLSLLTGSKAGPLRSLAGVFGALTTLVQLGSTGFALYGGVRGGTPWLALLPSVVAMLSTLVMAVKTTIVAFGRK